ncbi:DNA helicase-2/ATP-dependent DNA helicase PcrA [Actinoalloteichus hoggarensis]|uniref:ATP-dependent DNA helicase UvrD2 n=1 Tax=Actinoalloteichus hoggarensis TaxID=1470176 RepID=A0A221VYM1_9PSEU|nr:ATP-dependent DNA helicase UvrD2 [Actinoalloteichus hoggarensis]ASO18594.1 ATP-dependent DNA helicase UvrD2 [Actinoalloteichus hoggarensis]MBB5921962.1 DNA helicase-2/ATP-dependent DNA helicase PcrA [Actinoalloteichus hoggarensis]
MAAQQDDPASGLDPEQQAAVLAPRGPVCVLAGAGTGKTRTITRRIANLVRRGHVAPGQVLAVTFTKRAAGEMRSRLRALDAAGVQALTFHAAALRQLRYFWPRVIGDDPWQLLDGKLPLIAQAARRAGAGTDRETLRDLASEIEWSKASLIAPESYPAAVARTQRATPAPADQIVAVYQAYERLKNEARVLDFDDILLHTAAVMEEHGDVAAEFRDRYRSFVVDEYQDVTPLQQRVLDAWLGERDDLTVVGDANQTIYSFAGASARPLLDFPRRFPEAAVIRLERDYRSTPEIVSLANRVIEAARNRPAGSRLRLIGQQPPGPPPSFAEHDDEAAEAASVARGVKNLIAAGTSAGEIAILFRVNAQSEVYEQALSEADVPYQVRGGERFFARPEVRQAVTALRTEGALTEDRPLPARVRAVLARLGLGERPPEGGAARERWESLRALAELAEETANVAPETDLARFVVELDQRAEARHPPAMEGVTLASLHAAKGLEWDAVFLVGLTEGTLPLHRADGDDAAVDEERRLFYVGVTRARRHLALSWALARAEGGRRYRRRSRFLYGLAPEDHPASAVARASTTRGAARAGAPRCRVCSSALTATMAIKLGRCEHCPADLDQELLERLRAWRGDRARKLGVPGFVVLTDATLTAIAEQRPSDVAALVRIPGIGATKLDRFGTEVISLVREAGASP